MPCQDQYLKPWQTYLDTLVERRGVLLPSVQSLYHVELKSSLRMRPEMGYSSNIGLVHKIVVEH
jgi:hypothetical protein